MREVLAHRRYSSRGFPVFVSRLSKSQIISGVGVGGTLGAITGALVGMGIPEYEAKRYEGRVKEGGILLSVHADDSNWVKKAKDILENTGADDISSTSEARADFQKSDKPMQRAS